ncbi:MAG: hypothetical protein QXS00_00900 [Pyrobaculum sp.]|uniref:hypothetical protein n=1 Tax=Pyrobaculum sp. TaxID=2004705 RepID=UPI00316006FE
MTSTEFSWHAIAVGNRLLGLYNFLVLTTPPGWRVVIMPMASDVFRHVEIGDVKWVKDGEVMHFLRDGDGAYPLKISAKPGKKRLDGERVIINGHEGVYRVKEKKGRLSLELSFYCDVTDRTLKITVEDLKDLSLLKYIVYSRCH